jgi:hypothetical protein
MKSLKKAIPVCGGDRIGDMNLWAWGTFSPP